MQEYFDRLAGLLRELQREEDHVRLAAEMLTGQIEKDRLIWVFGVGGHSVIGCEEFFWRAGGLSNVSPLFDASLLLSGGGRKSTLLERVSGIGDKVVGAQELGPNDLLVITSIYGMNAATIDAALEAKSRGAKVVAITSREHSTRTPANFKARHPSGHNLADLADVTIDNHVPYGDTVISLEGLAQPVGPVSTALVSACVQWLVIEVVRMCLERGIEPPVWRSANTVGGDEFNAGLMARFLPRIKAL